MKSRKSKRTWNKRRYR